MLHKVILPTTVNGAMRPEGYVFDLPEGTLPPGSHAQGEGGMLTFRPYAVPLNDEEIEQHLAHEARLKADAEAAAAAEHEVALAQPHPPGLRLAGQRVRLTAQAQVDGALREPGYEFFLPEGEKGPTRAVRKSHERIDLRQDSLRIDGEVVDEPLYEVVADA